ncbi:MAG: DNA-3-methyladenine glycosylase family protein [Thermonemataceae bacterium]
MLDLAKQHLSTQDEVMKMVIETVAFPQVVSTRNVFHDLMSCIVEQQIHYRSTKKLFEKLLGAVNLSLLTPTNFPTFEEALKEVKLSTRKYETIHNTLHFFQENEPDWTTMDDAAVHNQLTGIKGIGGWTADMILLYTLERPNVCPYDDYHLKQITQDLYALKDVKKTTLKNLTKKWLPYQSFAVKYLLAWKEARKNKSL